MRKHTSAAIPAKQKVILCEGNEAAALGVALARPDMVAVYPITPQSSLVEHVAKLIADGRMDADIVDAEGEHSVLSVLQGGALAGARTYTATCGPGLAFMFEPYFRTSGMRLPIVMSIVTRDGITPQSVWGGHQDAMTVREVGWVQVYCETVQEVLDTTIMAFKIAEHHDVMLPVNVCLDGNYLSYGTSRVELPDQAEVDAFMGDKNVNWHVALDPLRPMAVDPLTGGSSGKGPSTFVRYRKGQCRGMQNSLRVIEEVHEEWARRFGRRYAPLVEDYRMEDADFAIMTLGSMTGAGKDAIDEARDAGKKVGLIKIKTFSPFPVEALAQVAEERQGAGRGRSLGRLPLELRADVPGDAGRALPPGSACSIAELHRRAGRRRHHDHALPSRDRRDGSPAHRISIDRAGLAQREGLIMEQTKYLVVGSSHAALEALTAIRMHDAEGSLTLLTRDPHLPYSPTVLPYVVSGRSAADNVFLRDENFFAEQKISLKRGKALKTLHASRNTAELADGSEIAYEKLLLATGASPAIPPIPGIDQVSYHVLRTLDDATKLNAAMKASKQAVVMGAGLVGMHAAENLVKAGAKVTIVEMAKQLTDGYFRCHGGGADREGLHRQRRHHPDRQSGGQAGAFKRICHPGCHDHLGKRRHAGGRPAAGGHRRATQHGLPRGRGRGGGARQGHPGQRTHADQRAERLRRRRLRPGQELLFRHQGDERHPARCHRAGPHRRHGDGRRSRHQGLSRRDSGEYLPLLRSPCDFGRIEQGARRRRGGDPFRRSQRPLPQGDFPARAA
jgi:phenylglyoxylate dehydrogenase alpha subunit